MHRTTMVLLLECFLRNNTLTGQRLVHSSKKETGLSRSNLVPHLKGLFRVDFPKCILKLLRWPSLVELETEKFKLQRLKMIFELEQD